jgi:citrate lyase subunit beta / citryl-CoA lyase
LTPAHTPVRSWLFAPGHSEKLLGKVFEVGADAVVLDLEDAVPHDLKQTAREVVAAVLGRNPAWVRINPPRTPEAEADLAAIGRLALGLRLPKVESAADVAWVAERAPEKPLACTIETAVGLVRVFEIAAAPATDMLVLGAADLAAELRLGDGVEPLLFASSQIVGAARAAGLAPPVDGAYTGADGDGVRQAAQLARRLGFGSKSAVRPHQVPIINEVFSPTEDELRWARNVIDAFEASGGAASRLEGGELVDLPIAKRARQILELGAR